jgi:hypothetical protein
MSRSLKQSAFRRERSQKQPKTGDITISTCFVVVGETFATLGVLNWGEILMTQTKNYENIYQLCKLQFFVIQKVEKPHDHNYGIH